MASMADLFLADHVKYVAKEVLLLLRHGVLSNETVTLVRRELAAWEETQAAWTGSTPPRGLRNPMPAVQPNLFAAGVGEVPLPVKSEVKSEPGPKLDHKIVDARSELLATAVGIGDVPWPVKSEPELDEYMVDAPSELLATAVGIDDVPLPEKPWPEHDANDVGDVPLPDLPEPAAQHDSDDDWGWWTPSGLKRPRPKAPSDPPPSWLLRPTVHRPLSSLSTPLPLPKTRPQTRPTVVARPSKAPWTSKLAAPPLQRPPQTPSEPQPPLDISARWY
jgi:hypothetical protein